MDADIPTRPTLADVAARAGVSASTASLAFSGSGPVSETTRERVLAAARELDYGGPDPRARSLRRGRSGIVGVVVEERVREAFRDPIKIAMLDGLAEAIGPLGAGLLLLTDTGGGAVSIASTPLDAVVLIGCSPRLGDSVAVLRQRGIPMVAIEGDPGEGVTEISLDNRDATRLGAQHLRALGHTDVALVTLPTDATRMRGRLTPEREAASTSATTTDRIAGTRDVFPLATGVVASASYIEEGLIAGRELLADLAGRPTAIIAQSDLLAAGVIRAAEELGLAVPADLSVLGFDGVRVDGLAPYDLTTLVQPATAKGRAAGEAIVRMLDGERPESVTFMSVFHLGNTTAPPRR
ncbi:LacI family DNA-binding transcriptional regulator [Luethyella okanaganae]|uniref:Substrate-binding domain-containing protein n=1 Tax=Luethyella okanaganae TaxID=69372 RepID=A0ABW1VER5_9MICO